MKLNIVFKPRVVGLGNIHPLLLKRMYFMSTKPEEKVGADDGVIRRETIIEAEESETNKEGLLCCDVCFVVECVCVASVDVECF